MKAALQDIIHAFLSESLAHDIGEATGKLDERMYDSMDHSASHSGQITPCPGITNTALLPFIMYTDLYFQSVPDLSAFTPSASSDTALFKFPQNGHDYAPCPQPRRPLVSPRSSHCHGPSLVQNTIKPLQQSPLQVGERVQVFWPCNEQYTGLN